MSTFRLNTLLLVPANKYVFEIVFRVQLSRKMKNNRFWALDVIIIIITIIIVIICLVNKLR